MRNHMAYLAMVAGCESLNGADTQGIENEDLGNGNEGGSLGNGDLPTSTDAAVEEVRADLAEAVNVVEEAAQAVEAASTALESHEEAVEALVEEVAGMESMLNSGSFSPIAFADKYNRAVKYHVALGGANMNRCGAESINDVATARLFSVAGIEGFMDSVKAGAGKAIDFIRSIFNSMINFFVGMVDQSKAMERRSSQLLDRLNKKGQLREKIKLGGWNIGCDYESSGLKGIEGVTGSDMFDLVSNSLPAFMDLSKNMNGINAAGFKTAYKNVTGDIKGVAKALGTPNVSDKGDHTNILMVHAGFKIFATFDEKYEKEEEMISAAKSIKLQFGKAEGSEKFSKGEASLKANIGELKGALATVKEYVNEIRSSKVQAKFSKASRDQVIGNLNVAIKAADGAGGTGDEKKKQAKESIALCKAIYVSSSNLANTMTRLYSYLARQLLDAVAAHIA